MFGIKKIALLTSVLMPLAAAAQWEAGAGLVLHSPMMYNSSVRSHHHAASTLGGRMNIRHLPRSNGFLPQLDIEAAPMVFPVVRSGDLVINGEFTYLGASLGSLLHYQISEDASFNYGIGIGAGYFDAYAISIYQGVGASGNQYTGTSSQRLHTWAPHIKLLAEYSKRISHEIPLFMGISGQLNYNYFIGGTDLDIALYDQNNILYTRKVSLEGSLINPVVQVQIYYRFGERDLYY